MLTTLSGGTTLATACTFATTISGYITSGSQGWSQTSWTKGLTLSAPVTSATGWASEANVYVCSSVIPSGVAAVQGVDLSGAYYTGNVHVLRIQMARGTRSEGFGSGTTSLLTVESILGRLINTNFTSVPSVILPSKD